MPSDAQTAPIAPGPDGTPIPSGLRLIRMANDPKLTNLSPEALRLANEGKAIPSFFDLSSEDKKQPVPSLSVWVEALTPVSQAWILVGANPNRNWVVYLQADKVRAIFAASADKLPPTPSLDVHWERATVPNGSGERVPDMRPGWEGHAGIINLDKGNKTQRNSLRWQLAESAVIQVLSYEQVAEFARTATEPSSTIPMPPPSTDST
jgi:hypothetical protein